jgi:hypothetical protein
MLMMVTPVLVMTLVLAQQYEEKVLDRLPLREKLYQQMNGHAGRLVLGKQIGYPPPGMAAGGANYKDMVRGGAAAQGYVVHAPHSVRYPFRDRDAGTTIPADVQRRLDEPERGNGKTEGRLFDRTPPQMGALIAPRPLLVRSGKLDKLMPIEDRRRLAERARFVYEKVQSEDRFVFNEFEGGHDFHGEDVRAFLKKRREPNSC